MCTAASSRAACQLVGRYRAERAPGLCGVDPSMVRVCRCRKPHVRKLDGETLACGFEEGRRHEVDAEG